ncbi:MAG: MBOAT family O-acyltransferase, partial [Rhodospirillales bacterium]
NFMIENVNALLGGDATYLNIVLPLAISFYTFQQIAYLLDTYAGLVDEHGLLHYSLFVIFFPQLIIGPIVHHREMIPQFTGRRDYRIVPSDISVGLSIFALGLFKKFELADGLEPYVTVVFEHAESGSAITLIDGWLACIGYTLQIYFDFSGYSDMALGLARLFGIALPLNFNSPYRATSFLSLWRRWHMTMTRFFIMYVFTPLSVVLVRRFRGLSGLRGPRFAIGLALPLFITFVLSGLWHGAAWGYVLCFAINGAALLVNHGWRLVRLPAPPAMIGWFVTFTVFAISLVFFRAEHLDIGWAVIEGMIGLNGVALAPRLVEHLPMTAQFFETLGFAPTIGGALVSSWIFPRLALSLFVVLMLPNLAQLFRDNRPVVDSTGITAKGTAWRPTTAWAVACAVAFSWAMIGQSHPQEFIYFQF